MVRQDAQGGLRGLPRMSAAGGEALAHRSWADILPASEGVESFPTVPPTLMRLWIDQGSCGILGD
jgi:hypothetical protein